MTSNNYMSYLVLYKYKAFLQWRTEQHTQRWSGSEEFGCHDSHEAWFIFSVIDISAGRAVARRI